MLKFMYNGIKDSNGNLHKAWYSYSETFNGGMELNIYSSQTSCSRFESAEIIKEFTVENDTDTMTDYFRPDSIKVPADHKHFKAVIAATVKQEKKTIKRLRNRLLKCKAYMISSIEKDIINHGLKIKQLEALL